MVIQLDKKLGDQKILADLGGFLAIGDFFGRQYYLSNCRGLSLPHFHLCLDSGGL